MQARPQHSHLAQPGLCCPCWEVVQISLEMGPRVRAAAHIGAICGVWEVHSWVHADLGVQWDRLSVLSLSCAL